MAIDAGGHRRFLSPGDGMSARNGHTLVELVIVIFIISVLTWVAVPRLPFGAVDLAGAESIATRIATDLRRARSRAILHAAENPDGYAVTMVGGSPYDGYQIVDLSDSGVLATQDIPQAVHCTGGCRFEFGPLGNLKDGSDSQLQVSAENRTITIRVVPATGMVKCS